MSHEKIYHTFSDLKPAPEVHPAETVRSKHIPNGKGCIVYVLLDTRGRKGKSVTLISGMRHNPATLENIARLLKQSCGAGGTMKDGVIEIQGDHRERISKILAGMQYSVK